jgi:hypothetical protein
MIYYYSMKYECRKSITTLAVAILTLAVLPSLSHSADRLVIGELFTNFS